jgi:hypothetical protein
MCGISIVIRTSYIMPSGLESMSHFAFLYKVSDAIGTALASYSSGSWEHWC